MELPIQLIEKLNEKVRNNELRSLKNYPASNVDFFSNDYIGIVKQFNSNEFDFLSETNKSGATGSRLISGNSDLYDETEAYLADFYNAESTLLFSSGYMANVGLLSTIPQQTDLIIYDQYIHASLWEGIKLSKANAISFNHNCLTDLEIKLQSNFQNCFVVVESLYSMDGDFGLLKEINNLCKKYNAYLIVDEAHTSGLYGNYGEGTSIGLDLSQTLARVHTFGKGIGCHGAVIVGSTDLKKYLINFCKSFIYTTGLSDFMLLHIKSCHQLVKKASENRIKLQNNIDFFNQKIEKSKLSNLFLKYNSPIQGIIESKEKLKIIETKMLENKFNVKAIYSPSVPRGKERIRISLHSFNTFKEINDFFNLVESI